MTPPLVSVIIPVHNAARYLTDALDSVCNQTYENLEILICDDGSSDTSLSILNTYAAKDSRIKVLAQPSSGIVESLNKLISSCNGDFIARMDADDIAQSARIETQLSYFQTEQSLGVLGSKVSLFGSSSGTWHYRQCDAMTRQLMALGNTPLCHPSIMVKKSVYEKFPYTNDYPHMEDLDWFQTVAVDSKISMYATRETLLNYRVHEGQISSLNAEEQLNQRCRLLARFWQRHNISFAQEHVEMVISLLHDPSLFTKQMSAQKSWRKTLEQLEHRFPGIESEIERRCLG